MSSLASFYQRSLYKEMIYPSVFPPPLDVWYNKLLYGRIDRFQNSIVPAVVNLTPIPSAARINILALKVVVKAFEKFVRHIKRANLAGVLDSDANPRLIDVKAFKGYESPHSRYSSFTQGLYDVFVRNLTGDQSDKIKNFQSFLGVYGEYMLNIAAVTPVTKTNYLLSNNGSTFTSGLSIAIANEDPGDDGVKYESFINDPNFEFFRKCAKKFGFTLNKNAPWILTADLFSKAFKETSLKLYTLSRGRSINKDNFFDIFYDKTYLTDFDELKNILINSYSNFIKASPYYDEGRETLKSLNNKCLITPKPRAPGPSRYQIFDAEVQGLPAAFLIDLYIDLRQVELGSPLTQKTLKKIKTKARAVYVTRPNEALFGLARLENVAEYVNVIFRDYIHGFGAMMLQLNNVNFNFDVDNRVSGGRILLENNINRQLY